MPRQEKEEDPTRCESMASSASWFQFNNREEAVECRQEETDPETRQAGSSHHVLPAP